MDQTFWLNRRVLVTGHTGFKGTWLTAWLENLGASVAGLSLAPLTGDMYALLDGWQHRSNIVDIRDGDIKALVESVQPEVVFHLAAQSTVRNGYRDPAGTFATNVMGTVRLLDALRDQEQLLSTVIVTTDKVYGNRPMSFTEVAPLKACDPYSGSKVGQEVAVESFRYSYFGQRGGLVTARAGNVIGGGDDGPDRLIPDCVRAARVGEPITLRYPEAVRPWQHVVEPLHGYLAYAEACAQGRSDVPSALNFGPDPAATASVRSVAQAFLAKLTREPARIDCEPVEQLMAENTHLTIDASAAAASLGWKPMLDVDTAIDWTAGWYRAALAGDDLREFTLSQIALYEELLG